MMFAVRITPGKIVFRGSARKGPETSGQTHHAARCPFRMFVTRMVFIATVLLAPCVFAAEDSAAENTATTWLDLGLNLPEDFPTDAIPLFEGLNAAQGTWAFDGQQAGGDAAATLQGSVKVVGVPQGMLPMWRLLWSWPADDPELAIMHIIDAGPRKDGFDLMLTQIGPIPDPESKTPQPGIVPVVFLGTWDSQTRTLTWVEGAPVPGAPRQSSADDSLITKPKRSFEMVVGVDGRITIRNAKHMSTGQLLSARAGKRTADAAAQPEMLTGRHTFERVAEIVDPRIKPWLPPQATEISLFSEGGGHFARYRVGEQDFLAFVDQLWETGKDESAHEREAMSGEGEPAKADQMARRFGQLQWEPLENAVIYYSPSKSNGAMTTYYYDRKAGIAYHDRGYW